MTVVITCKQCGAVNNAEASTCCFCDARLSPNTRQNAALAVARPKTPRTEGNLVLAPDWHSEVASRLEAYRVRRKHLGSDSSQSPQPEFLFGDDPHETPPHEASAPESSAKLAAPPAPQAQSAPTVPSRQQRSSSPERVPFERVNVDRVPPERMPLERVPVAPINAERMPAGRVPLGSISAERAPAKRQPLGRADVDAKRAHSERFDIDVAQPALDFGPDAYTLPLERPWQRQTAQRDPASPSPESSDSPAAFPVAAIAERRRAALLDAALLLFAYGGFLSLFVALGGRFALSLFDVGVVASTLALFYAQYVALFTFFGGSTPGMMLRHLRVVSFDGADPTPAQLVWRSFGYLLSAAILMFGFLASLWDRDHLCWHDRISQTYLTSAEQPAQGESSAHLPQDDFRF